MTDILTVIDLKRTTLTAKTPKNEIIKLYITFNALMENGEQYMLLIPMPSDICVSSTLAVYKYTEVNKLMSLVPATDDERKTVLNFYNVKRKQKDLIELYDENGNNTGKRQERTKGNVTPEGTYFSVVEAWVKTVDGKLLLLQRHKDKDFGLKWECPGGTVALGESVNEAIVRELYEETGIIADESRFTYLGVTKHSNWFCHSYLLNLGCARIDVRLQKEECTDYKYVGLNETKGILEELTEGHRETYLKYRDKLVSIN